MTTTTDRTKPKRCGIPHPKYSSYKCYREAGHTGVHHARHNGRSRMYQPYLPVFAALTRGFLWDTNYKPERHSA